MAAFAAIVPFENQQSNHWRPNSNSNIFLDTKNERLWFSYFGIEVSGRSKSQVSDKILTPKCSLILPRQTNAWLVLQTGHASYDALLHADLKTFERRAVIILVKTASKNTSLIIANTSQILMKLLG